MIEMTSLQFNALTATFSRSISVIPNFENFKTESPQPQSVHNGNITDQNPECHSTRHKQ